MGSSRYLNTNTLKFSFLVVCLSVFLASCNSDPRQYVKIETSLGDISVVLYDETPLHRDNFVKLVNESFYDSLLFHRVIDGFMVQGGDPESKGAPKGMRLGNGGPGYTIPAEIGSPHLRGTLAAARLSDNINPQRESSGSQFYIVHGQPVTDAYLNSIEQAQGIKYNDAQRQLYKELGGTPQLDGAYTVFGEVVSGMEVIDKIAAEAVDRANRPEKDIWMKIELE